MPLPPGSLKLNPLRVRGLFDAIDTDHSGLIDVKELESYFRNLSKTNVESDHESHLRKDAAKELSAELLEDLSPDAMGRVSYKAFEKFVLQRESELWELFQTLDKSGDNRLDREELRSALADLELSLHEQNRFIESLESRATDGMVDFATFRDLFLLNPDEETSLAKAFRYYSATHRFGHSLFGMDWLVLPQEAARAEELQSNIVLATGISAIVSRTLTAPLDRIRLFYQLGGLGGHAHRLPRRGTRTYNSAKRGSGMTAKFKAAIRQISKDGGLFRGLWRGTFVNLMKVPLESSARVASLGYFRFAIATREGCPDEPHDISRKGMMLASGLSAGIAAVMLQPLDNVRTRMMSAVDRIADSDTDLKALQDSKSKTGHPPAKAAHPPALAPAKHTGTSTFTKSLQRIYTTQGLRGFYKGTLATLLSAVPFISTSEFIYDSLEKTWFDNHPPGPEGYHPPPIPLVLAMAATSAICAELAFYPLLLVRSRMMAQSTPLHPYSYSSTWDCIRQTYKKNGLPGFYRGAGVTMLKAVPTVVVGYAAYEGAKRGLGMEWNRTLGIWEDPED